MCITSCSRSVFSSMARLYLLSRSRREETATLQSQSIYSFRMRAGQYLSFRSSSSLPISSSRSASRVLSLSDLKLSISRCRFRSVCGGQNTMRLACMFAVVELCSFCKARSLACRRVREKLQLRWGMHTFQSSFSASSRLIRSFSSACCVSVADNSRSSSSSSSLEEAWKSSGQYPSVSKLILEW
jgi:hypothetical protein